MGVVDEAAIGERFRGLAGELAERQGRLWAAAEARSAGRGGIAATGIAADTIRKGIREFDRLQPVNSKLPGDRPG